MQKYEVTYLTASANKVESVEKAIKELDGNVIESNDLGVKELAYPVRKLTEARFVSVIFNLSPENLNALKKKIAQDKLIIRFILIKALRARKEVKERYFKKDKPKIVEKSPAKAKPKVPSAPEKEKKVAVKLEPEVVKKPIEAKVKKTPGPEIKKPKIKPAEEPLSGDALDQKLKELVED